ncbi:MAG: InlB B-repeat-containing protein, partial [Clostridia bacterium]|nr:InlB B-repeat-containing protein [Clostridia bacterium]
MKRLVILLSLIVVVCAIAVGCSPKTEQVTVSFDASNGSELNYIRVDVGSLVSKPATPVRDGYDFLGWTLPDGSRWNFDTDTVSETVTLTASWKCLHDFDNSCDTKCNNCGYERNATHKWSNKCDTNCNVCGYVRSITHEWSNNCDGICNICGFERQPAAHVYDHVV